MTFTVGAVLPTVTGTYVWSAVYSGDSTNSGASDNGQNESVAVANASPSVATTAGGTVVVGSGSKLSDSATLSDGYNATGTITDNDDANGRTVSPTSVMGVIKVLDAGSSAPTFVLAPLEGLPLPWVAAAGDVDVLYEPDLLPRPRYRNDHGGEKPAFSADDERRWASMLASAEVSFDFDYRDPSHLLDNAPELRWVQATSAGIGGFVQQINLAAVLGTLDDYKVAKILAQPTLVSLSGQKAEFLSGGQVPIPTPQGGGQGSTVSHCTSSAVAML